MTSASLKPPQPGMTCWYTRWSRDGNVIERKWRMKERESVAESADAHDAKPKRGALAEQQKLL